MLDIVPSNQFKKDLKLAKKRGLQIDHLRDVINTLARGHMIWNYNHLHVCITLKSRYHKGTGILNTHTLLFKFSNMFISSLYFSHRNVNCSSFFIAANSPL